MTHDVAYYASLDYLRWTQTQRLVQRLIALLVRATMRVRVEGLEHVPPSGPAIIAGNHLSLLDSVVVIPHLPRPTILLLAEELRVWPWIGLVLGRIGNAILVRRGRNGVARLAVRTGAPVVPVAIWGQERAFRSWRRLRRAPVDVRFGASPSLGNLNASAPTVVTTRVMVEIARLLPPEYRGAYADA